MNKILITFGLILFATNFAFSNETKCLDFKKFSREYIKCSADKIKNATINKTKKIKEGAVKKNCTWHILLKVCHIDYSFYLQQKYSDLAK